MIGDATNMHLYMYYQDIAADRLYSSQKFRDKFNPGSLRGEQSSLIIWNPRIMMYPRADWCPPALQLGYAKMTLSCSRPETFQTLIIIMWIRWYSSEPWQNVHPETGSWDSMEKFHECSHFSLIDLEAIFVLKNGTDRLYKKSNYILIHSYLYPSSEIRYWKIEIALLMFRKN